MFQCLSPRANPAMAAIMSPAYLKEQCHQFGQFGQNNDSVELAITLLVHRTSINHLLLWMALMEMDCNLKKLANFLKVFPCIVEKLLKLDYSLFFLGGIPECFLPSALTTISC